MDETPKKKTAGAAQQVGTGSVSEEQIEKAQETLTKYKDGKKAVDSRIIENEKWFRLRHWTAMEASSNKVQPASGWLFNALANKHASAMDNYPSPVVLPREAAVHIFLFPASLAETATVAKTTRTVSTEPTVTAQFIF